MSTRVSSPMPSDQHIEAPTSARLSLLEHKHSAALALWMLTLAFSLYLTGIYWVGTPSNAWPPSQAKTLWFGAFIGSWTVTRCWQDLVTGSRSLTPLRWQQQWRGAWWQWQGLLLVLHAVLIGIVVLKQQSLLAQAAAVGLLALGCQVMGTALAWNTRWWQRSAKGLSRLSGVAWWSSLRLVDVGKARHGQPLSVAAVLVYAAFIPLLMGILTGALALAGGIHAAQDLFQVSVSLLCGARLIVSPHLRTPSQLWPARRSAWRALRSTLLHTLGLILLVTWGPVLVLILFEWLLSSETTILLSLQRHTPTQQAFLAAQAQIMVSYATGMSLILWLMARLPDKPLWRDAVMLIPAALGLVWWALSGFDPLLWQAAPLSLPSEPIAPLALSLLLLWDTHRHWPAAQPHAFVPA